MEAALATSAKPSRAQAIRDMVEIRLAVNEAGSLIEEVLRENGIEVPGADWSNVFPYWLIACVDDQVIGCCQVLRAKPVGYLEFLFVRPSAPFKLRAIAIRKLLIQGFATLYTDGCNYVGGVVATKNLKFVNVLQKLHFAKAFPAELHLKRLA